MTKNLLLLLLHLYISNIFGQNSICSDSTIRPLCGQLSNVSAPESATTAQSGPSYGCLLLQPNPNWYFIQASSSDSIRFILSQRTGQNGTGLPLDVDFILWGPFDQPRGNCDTGLKASKIISCSYSQFANEVIRIPNPVPNKYYILMITNFSGQAGYYNLTTTHGSTNCNLSCSISLGQDTFFCGSSYDLKPILLPGVNFDTFTYYKTDTSNQIGKYTSKNHSQSITSKGTYIIKALGYDNLLQQYCIAWDTINIDTVPPPPSPPKIDTLCSGSAVSLNVLNPLNRTVVWKLQNSSGVFTQVSNANPYQIPTIDSTTTYSVGWAQSGCFSKDSVFKINVYPKIDTPIVDYPKTICLGTSLTMIASAGDSTHWFNSATATSPFLKSDTNSYLNPTTTITVFALKKRGNCSSPRIRLETTISPVPTKPTFSMGNSFCFLNFPTSVFADSVANSQLHWFSPTSKTQLLIADTLYPNFGNKDTSFYVKRFLGNCYSPDSTVVRFNQRKLDTQRITICKGQSYKGQTQSGVYTTQHNIGTACDSQFTLFLTVNDTNIFHQSASICFNDSFLFNGRWLKNSGLYSDTFVNISGCDSIRNLQLLKYPNFSSTTTISICNGDQLNFNGIQHNLPGSYSYVVRNYLGCDSTATLNLLVRDTFRTNLTETICFNSPRFFKGQWRNTSGIYIDTLVATNGCDSIVQLSLFVNDTHNTRIFSTICNNQSYYHDGITYRNSGTYTRNYLSSQGCDSLVIINLQVNNVTVSNITETICNNEFYDGYNKAGIYTDTFFGQNSQGCDSIRNLRLNIISDTIYEFRTICFGQNMYGHTTTGIHTDSIRVIPRCLSTRILNLRVLPPSEGVEEKTICYGESYLGYNKEGIYTDILLNSNGCDSTRKLILKIRPKPIAEPIPDTSLCKGDTISISLQKGFFLYTWKDGTTQSSYTITDSGKYYYRIMDSFKCVDFDTFDVQLRPKNNIAIVQKQDIVFEGEKVLLNLAVDSSSPTEKIRWYSNLPLSCSNCRTTEATAVASDWVYVDYSNNVSCPATDTFWINVTSKERYIYFPNSFSPNGDMVNDIFIPESKNIKSIVWEIYNRLGEKVFESTRPENGWDGNFKGSKCMSGSYIWRAKVVFNTLEEKVFIGEFILVR